MTGRLFALFGAVALVSVVGTACSLSPGSQSSNKGTFLRKPNPVTVTEHLDTTHSATAVIDSAGGTLSVTGGDGVKYTLTIPADALPLSQLIRMTPVAAVDGLPWHGGLLAAVHLQPDGTQLLKPATLVAEGVKPAPPGTHATGFMYEGTGTDFHLYSLDSGQSVQFHLVHFSSPGIGGASQQDVTNQLQRAPTTPLEQLEQDIAVEVSKLGQGAHPPDVAAAVQKLLNDFEQKVLAPELGAAVKPGATFEQFIQAFSDLSGWKRLADLYGLEALDYQQLVDKWRNEVPRMLKDQINACFDKHDVRAGMLAGYLLSFAVKSGIEIPGTELDAIFRCLRFKLNFDTQLHSQDSHTFTITSHVAANAVRPIAIGKGGSAPLNYISFEWQTISDPALQAGGCVKSSSTRVIDDFRVLGMQGLELDTEGGKKWQLTDFFVNLTPGKAVETMTVSCPGPIVLPTGSGEAHYYNNNWENLHSDEQVRDYFAISGWSIHNGNALFAQKRYDRSGHYADVTVTEMTTLNLYHDPEGAGIS